MIPYLLPKQPQEKNDSLICKIEIAFLSISLYNTNQFTTIFTIITYMGLKYTNIIEKKEKCLKWTLSIISWAIAGSGGIILASLAKRETADDLVCWIKGEIAILGHLIDIPVFMIITLWILFLIKRNLKVMIENREIEERKFDEYNKSYKNILFFSVLIICSLIIEFMLIFILKNYDKTKISYFLIVFSVCCF